MAARPAPAAETYLSKYPGLVEDDEAAFELIYGEYLLREEHGEPPSPEELSGGSRSLPSDSGARSTCTRCWVPPMTTTGRDRPPCRPPASPTRSPRSAAVHRPRVPHPG